MAFCTKREIDALKQQIKFLKIRRVAMLKRVVYIDTYGLITTTYAMWCADLTVDLAIGSEWASCEIPEYREGVYATGALNIRPAYSGRAVHSPTRDGWITPNAALGPFSSFLYRSIFPGWQKFKPTYRYGTISNINLDNDTCTVDLDSVISSESEHAREDLNINQESRLIRVPIQYLDCNAQAFTAGEKVIVEFVGQNQDDPLVIGFEKEPQPCFPYWEPWPGPNWCSSGNQWQIWAFFFGGFVGVTEYIYGSGSGPDLCPVDKKDSRFLIDTTGFHVNLTVPATAPSMSFNSRVRVIPPVIPGTFSKMKFSGDFTASDETFVRVVFKDAGGVESTTTTVLLHFKFGATSPSPGYILPPSFTTGDISYADEEVDISSISQPFQKIEIVHVCGTAGNSINASIKYIDFIP